MRVLVPAAARRSRRVIVDAASTADDLVGELGVPRERIDVVPLAAAPPRPEIATDAAELRRRLGIPAGRVVLSPGARRPHKNLTAVLEALALMPAEQRPALVVPGYRTAYDEELRGRADALGLHDRVCFPAWLDAADLEGLYALADVVALPSRYEGFGLPVLEAMARGVPVVTSNRSSLPEVAGDAALLVDPDDAPGLRDALERVLGDPQLAQRLGAAGVRQAARVHLGADGRADGGELRARGRRVARIGCGDQVERRLDRQATGRWPQTTGTCSRAAPGPHGGQPGGRRRGRPGPPTRRPGRSRQAR